MTLTPPQDHNYESGFASASSVEENSFSIASRRRRPAVEPMITKVDPWRIEDDGSEILETSISERFIWLLAALWLSWRLSKLEDVVSAEAATQLSATLLIFTCLAFIATIFSFRAKNKGKIDVSSSYSSDDEDGEIIIERAPDTTTRRRRTFDVKSSLGKNEPDVNVSRVRDVRVGRSRLFGKSRASFRFVHSQDLFLRQNLFFKPYNCRSGADDGAICGILLTPLVACSKLIGAAISDDQNKNLQDDCKYRFIFCIHHIQLLIFQCLCSGILSNHI